MGRIEVDYEAIGESIIPKMKDCETNIAELYSSMDKVVKSLGQYMEAESADAYLVEFENLLGPDIKKLEELIAGYYTQLNQVVTQFANTDKELHDMITSF